MTEHAIKRFFASYARAFAEFNAQRICAHFHMPMSMSSPDVIMQTKEPPALLTNMAKLLSIYSAAGVAGARLNNMLINLLPNDFAFVQIEWLLSDSEGEVLTRFDTTYLLSVRERMGIEYVIAHNEQERFLGKHRQEALQKINEPAF